MTPKHLLVGAPFVDSYPSFHLAASGAFNIVVFDVMRLDETLERVANTTFEAGIVLAENLHLMSGWRSALATRDAKVGHFVSFSDSATALPPTQLRSLGLCDGLDSGMSTDTFLTRINRTVDSCAHHPPSGAADTTFLSGPASRSGILDQRIAQLVALGLSDREISDMLCHSNQSIRNKISRLLADHGYPNRTSIAAAELRVAFTRLLETPTPPNDDTRD